MCLQRARACACVRLVRASDAAHYTTFLHARLAPEATSPNNESCSRALHCAHACSMQDPHPRAPFSKRTAGKNEVKQKSPVKRGKHTLTQPYHTRTPAVRWCVLFCNARACHPLPAFPRSTMPARLRATHVAAAAPRRLLDVRGVASTLMKCAVPLQRTSCKTPRRSLSGNPCPTNASACLVQAPRHAAEMPS